MKTVLVFLFSVLLCNAASGATAEEDTRTYFIMNLEKNSVKKFEEMFKMCGGTPVRKINEQAIIAELTVQQGICVSENTKKIIIQITHRD